MLQYLRVFEWDDGNLDHIARHHVTPEGAEEVFADRRSFAVRVYDTATERRWGPVGATEDGRVLFVIYTHRAGRTIRVVTARDADPDERRRYRRR